MKRAALAIVTTVAGLVLLLSFKTHPASTPASPPAAVADPGATSGGSATASKTVTGAAADTRYGPVQVQVTVQDGKVTDVTAVDYPQRDPKDAQINSYAIPALNAEAESAQSASIDMISGATYTSQGYITSLQSALDSAGL